MKTTASTRWWIFLLLGLWLLPPIHTAAAAESSISKEYQLKAAFLYNFTRFIEWPPERLAKPTDPVVIGVFRANPFTAELSRLVQGRSANGRSIVVKTINTLDEARSVHLLFVPTGEEQPLQGADAALHAAAVVTVGESERFSAQNGMIVFVQEADKVRFTINLAAAEQAGLKFSSQLLKLAIDVRR